MTKPKIVVVIPTVRPEQYKSFLTVWKDLFTKHQVTLVTVWDGETPRVEIWDYNHNQPIEMELSNGKLSYQTYRSLICRYTDGCRNLGFIVAAHLNPDYILTLDDDVALPPVMVGMYGSEWPMDPIQSHLDVLQKKVPLSWMNTAHDSNLYLRGVPYRIRDEAPVMLSHGVWVGTPDFDGETQLELERCNQCDGRGWVGKQEIGTYRGCPKCKSNGKQQIPYSLPYYVGPIPKGAIFPLCGMNVMIRKEALPYFYFAPMGPDTGILNHPQDMSKPNESYVGGTLNRFADIWMGIFLKKEFDKLGWACYTGGSTILHTRASDAKKNFEQEKLGREWNEYMWNYKGWTAELPDRLHLYMTDYRQKRETYAALIHSIFLNKKGTDAYEKVATLDSDGGSTTEIDEESGCPD